MKPSRFRYVKPGTLDEAFALLAQYEDDARVLAGGQSLLAGLGMRLANPEVLVDINGLDHLSGISLDGDEVVIGALTRHVQVLESDLIAKHLPLVSEAIRSVAHMAVRNRGTFAGSLAYADPAAELPACAVASGATLVLGSAKGKRRVAASDFFLDIMDTALAADELILEIRFPVQANNQRHVFAELSRRHGDFALVGLAGIISADSQKITDAKLVYFGCVTHPAVAVAMSSALKGRSLGDALNDSEIQACLAQDISPVDNPGMRADTKLTLAAVVTRRQLNSLAEKFTHE